MSKNLLTHDFSINSLVGEGTAFQGELFAKGPLRIDGDFKGKIFSEGKVIVGKNGRADCIIVGKNVVVGGTFKGELIAEENVVILKTGKIFGNIYACSINMEDGVIFDGECRVLSKADMKELVEARKKVPVST